MLSGVWHVGSLSVGVHRLAKESEMLLQTLARAWFSLFFSFLLFVRLFCAGDAPAERRRRGESTCLEQEESLSSMSPAKERHKHSS